MRRDRAVLRILDEVLHANDVLRFHDEAVAYLVEGLEHHERAGALVRQTHILCAQPGHPAEISLVDRVAHIPAESKNTQHVARRQAVASAAVDDDHLVLADDGDAVGYGNDAALDHYLGRTGNEIQRNIDTAGEQLVAGFRLAAGLRHDESGRVAAAGDMPRAGENTVLNHD